MLALSATADAETYHRYDWQSGNNYTVNRDTNGATVNGYNAQNGTMWNERQNSNGTYHGTDSNGNFYSGNNRTGQYMNSNGHGCYGTGLARTCY